MAVDIISDVPYGDAPHQQANVYLPARRVTALPVVLFFHGGAWQVGDRRFDAERCRLWAEWGFAIANIEYRLATPGTPSWPAVQDDVEQVLEWAHGGLGSVGLEASAVGVAGISSGAHLAALLALADDRVRAAVLIAGVYDLAQLRDYWRLTRVDDPTVALLGADLPDDPGRYREASPQCRLHLLEKPPTASFLLLWTEDDMVAPARQQEAFAKSLEAVGVDTEYQSWPAGGHFGWCRLPGFRHPGGGMQDVPNPEANARARAFLKRTLGSAIRREAP